jgi:hypothetical protein
MYRRHTASCPPHRRRRSGAADRRIGVQGRLSHLSYKIGEEGAQSVCAESGLDPLWPQRAGGDAYCLMGCAWRLEPTYLLLRPRIRNFQAFLITVAALSFDPYTQ